MRPRRYAIIEALLMVALTLAISAAIVWALVSSQ